MKSEKYSHFLELIGNMRTRDLEIPNKIHCSEQEWYSGRTISYNIQLSTNQGNHFIEIDM